MKYIVIAYIFVYCTEAPNNVEAQACSITSPNYNKCLLDSFERLRPFFRKGIPEINFLPLDPFTLQTLNLSRNFTNFIKLQFAFDNIKLTGMADTVIKELKVNPRNLTGVVKLEVPWMHSFMEYKAKGQLIGPIEAFGDLSVNSTSVQLTIKATAKFVDKNAQKFLKLDKMFLKLYIGDAKITLRAKDKGTKNIVALMEYLFNNYSRLFLDLFNSELSETSTGIMRVMIDKILGISPAKEFL